MSNLKIKIRDHSKDAIGKQVWVVGDIHGEFEMFQELLDKIDYNPATHMIISVGDMVDRGADSPNVVAWLRDNGYAVLGNHEDMWLNTTKGVGMPYGDGQTLNDEWVRRNYGGGLGANGMDLTLNQFMDRGISAETWLGYFADLPHAIIVGDWMILHAGVHPARTFDQQRIHDVLWIRDKFMFGITPPESRLGKRLVVGHNETFWLGSVGKPVYRKDAVFVDIGTANQLELGAFCLNTGEFEMVRHKNFEVNAKRIAELFANQVFLSKEGDEYESIIASQAQAD